MKPYAGEISVKFWANSRRLFLSRWLIIPVESIKAEVFLEKVKGVKSYFTMLLTLLLNILVARGNPIAGSAGSLPIDIWRDQILMNTATLEEAIKMCQVNRQFYELCKPFTELKTSCALRNEDVWPPKMLYLEFLEPNRECIISLRKHSHLYERAFVTVPHIISDTLPAVELIQSLNPKLSLTFNFPNYNDEYNGQMLWSSINSEQLRSILDSIEQKKDRSVNIIMR